MKIVARENEDGTWQAKFDGPGRNFRGRPEWRDREAAIGELVMWWMAGVLHDPPKLSGTPVVELRYNDGTVQWIDRCGEVTTRTA